MKIYIQANDLEKPKVETFGNESGIVHFIGVSGVSTVDNKSIMITYFKITKSKKAKTMAN